MSDSTTAARVASLRRRLAIVDSVRDHVVQEIGRAERGLPSLLRGDGDAFVRSPSTRGALAVDKMTHRAKKRLCSAVDLLAMGDFGWGLEQAMLLLIMTAPDDSPRSRRDEILAAAEERGMSRSEIKKLAGMSDEALRQAMSRARKRKPKS